jgi:hypothetical protein
MWITILPVTRDLKFCPNLGSNGILVTDEKIESSWKILYGIMRRKKSYKERFVTL